ncbi:MAG: DNA polymerase IV [Erysipelotrichia bacterium]|nr:DNA polymerase IV [Erysipelotrichia bacterium]NCC55163.1 DNA polymerase IV [Erysipelotrichia bacterium]
MMARVIFHVDLNAYYASAEVVRNSALQGQPVVVGSLSKRGVICTASYEARKYGVRSAMPLYQALQLCPDLVIVKGDHDYYSKLSKQFFAFLKTYTHFIEIASIDECYMDVSDIIKNYKRPLDLAWEIQEQLLQKLKLPCSIGVAPNKFLAKMASDMRKPLGITVLRKHEIKTKLWPLSIDDMFGVGKKSAKLLKQMNIMTIGDFADPQNEKQIIKLLGKVGPSLIENARGNGNDQLVYNTSVQSISQSTTINHDVFDYEECKNVLSILTKSLVKRAKIDGITGKMVSISIRYHDFRNIVRSINLDYSTNDFNIILENALLLFDQHYEDIPLRHLGVGLGSLSSKEKTMEQLNLFKVANKPKIDVLEELNKQLGSGKLVYASTLLKEKE